MALFLSRQSAEERENLLSSLHSSQNGICFICDEAIDLEIHKNSIDIDHIVPTKLGGKDSPENFALTHSTCNRSKQASNLRIARILHRFSNIRETVKEDNRGPNLQDVFEEYGGSRYDIQFVRKDSEIKFSLPDTGQNKIISSPLFIDDLSGFEYFFTKLPIEYLYHDDKINPRGIGQNISKLINEFHLKRPQLHVSLGWIDLENGNMSKVKIFDGQHKAAAQVFLGTKTLPIRIFINPNPDVLLTANTNAGSTLRQVAFDKSVQRHLGSAQYFDRVERYKKDLGLNEDDYSFSERDLLKFFRGESREMKRYILDAVRDSITHHRDNKLKDYIDYGGRKKERPLSYSTIEKTFYSFFIYSDVLDTPLEYKLEEGENPRELETKQILHLLNLVAEEIFIGKFDSDIGTFRVEYYIQKGEDLPVDHIRAFRMSKEEILYNWLKFIKQVVHYYFLFQGITIQEKKLFQYPFPDPLWDKVAIFLKNLANLPVWINKELSQTVFGGKQNYEFWGTIFETGKSPQGLQVLAEPINFKRMIEE